MCAVVKVCVVVWVWNGCCVSLCSGVGVCRGVGVECVQWWPCECGIMCSGVGVECVLCGLTMVWVMNVERWCEGVNVCWCVVTVCRWRVCASVVTVCTCRWVGGGGDIGLINIVSGVCATGDGLKLIDKLFWRWKAINTPLDGATWHTCIAVDLVTGQVCQWYLLWWSAVEGH